MKTEYIKPATERVAIIMQTVLAGSGPGTNSGQDASTSNGSFFEARSMRYPDSDDSDSWSDGDATGANF